MIEFGEGVRVLAPKVLVSRIRKRLCAAASQYDENLPNGEYNPPEYRKIGRKVLSLHKSREKIVAHYVLVRIQEVKGGDDAAKAQWFPIDKVPQLAFDHDKILRDAMRKLRERIHFEPIGFELLPEKFTMRELQILYESILGVKFDRRNFAKKMMHYELLNQLDETVRPTAKRDALLYSFNKENYELFKKKGFQLEF